MRGRALLAGACAGLALGSGVWGAVAVMSEGDADKPNKIADVAKIKSQFTPTRTRAQTLAELKKPGQHYDVLVIGGGATGTGVALDAVTRGMKVALVEQEDFAAGTSSRSTKLIHGGVRYLEAAVKKLDYGQYQLVKEALRERTTFMDIAPHLSSPLPILTPCYTWWELPYYWIGMKAYDFVAGSHKIYGLSSRYVSRSESLRQFPMLAKEGFKGAIVYYDGQHNDSRMNVAIAVTAANKGADVANHVQVLNLIKDDKGKVRGANVRDTMTGESWAVHATTVINATGPFVDAIRQMDEPKCEPMIVASSGIHVILPDFYSPEDMGLIVPRTSDGRVIFLLPWEGKTIAGTTDAKSEVTMSPQAHHNEIDFILKSISGYLQVNVRRTDVTAAWAGIRPLARNPNAKDTKSMSRDHVIHTADSGMVTITGGKWTTYRAMAEECVNEVLKHEPALRARTTECVTHETKLVGADFWEPGFYTLLSQQYIRRKRGNKGEITDGAMDSTCAKHLSHNYGDRSLLVAEIAANGYGKKIAHGHPFVEAEVIYAMREEMACTVVDVIARRLRLAFLDAEGSRKALRRVVTLMADELKWDEARQRAETQAALAFLKTMEGQEAPVSAPPPQSAQPL